MTAAADVLPDDTNMLKAMLLAERAESERLRQIIKELQRHRFGRHAESLSEDQLLLALEEVEQVEATDEAEREATRPAHRAARAMKRRVNRCFIGGKMAARFYGRDAASRSRLRLRS